ncbi:WD40 repeat-like protein [Wilcoxina mikolae CBS 423.85]|nr:WD40 repeat-like protein [Wilcoxina mikolae CBS 423.85]
MSSFFTLPGSAKRKRADATGNKSKKIRSTDAPASSAKQSRKSRDEDEISSELEDDDAAPRGSDDEDEDEELSKETAAEKRLRLAQQYLDNIREEVDDGGFDAAEIDRDLIAERLKEDVAAEKGRLYRFIADDFSFNNATSTLFRMDSRATTGIAVCDPYIYTVTSDRYLIKWKLPAYPPPPATANKIPGRKPKRVRYARVGRKGDQYFEGHTQEIICVAASEDGKFVVTGGRDNKLIVWNAETLTILKVFKQHRAAVTGLTFRRGTNELYSSSADRTVKLWSLNELAYVDTLFGHQDEVVDIAALSGERCVTVGARDRTARLWKIVDETQLVFRGGGGSDGKPRQNKDGSIRHEEGSLDVVAMIDEEHFVTGSDNGNLSLWTVHKKKPIHTIPLSHGLASPPLPEKSSAEIDPPQEPSCPPQPRYVTALAIIPYANLIFSGSWDGVIRVWKVTPDKKKIEAVGTICGEDSVRGVVNGIAVYERGEKDDAEIVVCVGTGKVMRLGKWLQVSGRNGGYVMEVKKK